MKLTPGSLEIVLEVFMQDLTFEQIRFLIDLFDADSIMALEVSLREELSKRKQLMGWDEITNKKYE